MKFALILSYNSLIFALRFFNSMVESRFISDFQVSLRAQVEKIFFKLLQTYRNLLKNRRVSSNTYKMIRIFGRFFPYSSKSYKAMLRSTKIPKVHKKSSQSLDDLHRISTRGEASEELKYLILKNLLFFCHFNFFSLFCSMFSKFFQRLIVSIKKA